MSVFLRVAKGKGVMSIDGKDIQYPINKLLVSNGQDVVEIKLDKMARRLLTYLFDYHELDYKYEDDNGVQCDVFELRDKYKVDVNH